MNKCEINCKKGGGWKFSFERMPYIVNNEKGGGDPTANYEKVG